ncbi:DUF6499 domain-containing protein [Rhizobiaceae bacterium BDR2-2]|uniref:DUF6499 domain-containing protein n=1 Tax=Ectorhizobium quercum TaxID=2965071 RepID=A0AAE3SXS7_9HYPH|nr:DUF6499 domain-containing protein [Ectorhizobium quercum]MCX8999429.1 DUF6499 domain-containing protein [Ectorhizobium quercum]
MQPDTSRWRDRSSYVFFDELPIEGLAWECLRRNARYQDRYHALMTTNATEEPLSGVDERTWGLRFRGAAGTDIACPNRALVAPHQSCCRHARSDAAEPPGLLCCGTR